MIQKSEINIKFNKQENNLINNEKYFKPEIIYINNKFSINNEDYAKFYFLFNFNGDLKEKNMYTKDFTINNLKLNLYSKSGKNTLKKLIPIKDVPKTYEITNSSNYKQLIPYKIPWELIKDENKIMFNYEFSEDDKVEKNSGEIYIKTYPKDTILYKSNYILEDQIGNFNQLVVLNENILDFKIDNIEFFKSYKKIGNYNIKSSSYYLKCLSENDELNNDIANLKILEPYIEEKNNNKKNQITQNPEISLYDEKIFIKTNSYLNEDKENVITQEEIGFNFNPFNQNSLKPIDYNIKYLNHDIKLSINIKKFNKEIVKSNSKFSGPKVVYTISESFKNKIKFIHSIDDISKLIKENNEDVKKDN